MEKSPARWWDLPSAVFLFLAVLFSAWRLQSTNWVDDLGHVRNVALLGLILGLALGQSSFQRRRVILLSVGYMLVVFIWQWLRFIEFPTGMTYLGDRLLVLFGRLLTGLGEYFSGRPVADPLIFIALLSFPYWVVSLFSGYQLIRHANGLASILPSGILMFIIYLNHYTAQNYNWLFGAYLFAALLLLGRQKYLADKKKWTAERVQFSSESSLDFNNIVMFSAALLIFIAWIFPLSLPFNEQAKNEWQQTFDEWFSDDNETEEVFTFLNLENVPVSPADFLQTELSLGTQASQGDAITFLVYAPASARDIPRMYWRGYVYDRFEDGRWQSSELESLAFKPQDGDFNIPVWSQRRNLSFTFDVYEEGQNILYTPSQPLWVNRNATILHSNPISEEEPEEPLDVMILRSVPSLNTGEIYRVTALLASPTVSELQEAGQEYPEWVIERYLQIPDDFSIRIRELALQIAADHENPYDQASAITDYLRNEIVYASEMSFPEEPVDRLEYFLFESKQGFCNYYASAEVLMLRSIGIPARLAVGFAQGEPNLQNTLYTVRERNSHAWPEVYFPGYGWVEFEPTGNQDPLERPQERVETPTPTPNPLINPFGPQIELDGDETPLTELIDENPAVLLSRTQILRFGIFAGIILLIVTAIFLRNRYAPSLQATTLLKTMIEKNGWNVPAWLNNWLLWNSIPPIERYFHGINISLRWMGKPQPIHITAAERAAILRELVPASASSIETLLHEHQSHLFSLHGGNESLARRAAWSIIYQTIYTRLKNLILGYN
jgi:transglutaminase-like putative cysteine protease